MTQFLMLLLLTLLVSIGAWTTIVTVGGEKRNAGGATPRTTRVLSQNNRVHVGQAKRLRPLSMSGGDGKDEAARLVKQAAKLRADAEKLEAERKPMKAKKAPEATAAPTTANAAVTERDRVSDSMKEKLRKELVSQGADPNVSVGNPILIVSAIVALLVIVGGKGFFYGFPGTMGLEDVLRHVTSYSSSMSA